MNALKVMNGRYSSVKTSNGLQHQSYLVGLFTGLGGGGSFSSL
jgi:hypothetical protein